MTAIPSVRYLLCELHEFNSADQPLMYLVSAGAIFALDEGAHAVLRRLETENLSHGELVNALLERGYTCQDAEELIRELLFVQGIGSDAVHLYPVPAPSPPSADFPLHALVLNIP